MPRGWHDPENRMKTRDALAPLAFLFWMTVLLGGVYTLAVTGIAQLAFPAKANGSLLVKEDHVRGSTLLAQDFPGPRWFHARPSATSYAMVGGGARTWRSRTRTWRRRRPNGVRRGAQATAPRRRKTWSTAPGAALIPPSASRPPSRSCPPWRRREGSTPPRARPAKPGYGPWPRHRRPSSGPRG